jgi:predicted extracellular nuclease
VSDAEAGARARGERGVRAVARATLAGVGALAAFAACADGGMAWRDDSACGAEAARIHAVQGSSGTSPLAGRDGVTLEGIVVGSFRGPRESALQGFFLQEEDADADADPLTSEGIFVYDAGSSLADGLAVGDRVRVTGTVQEFSGMTELGLLTALRICTSDQSLPAAAVLTLPVPGVPSGDLAAARAAIDAYYERFEGMLVTVPGVLTVSEHFQLERFGQLVLTQGGRMPAFTAVHAPGAAGWIDHQIEVARRKVILDDRDDTQSSARVNGTALFHPQPGLSRTNRIRGGDTIADLTGVLHWSWAGLSGTDAWRIRPVTGLAAYRFTPGNPRQASPPHVGGSLTVASFNVLNYFTTIDTTAEDIGPCGPSAMHDCRGADSRAELARQTDKLVAALCGMNADIVGLVEIENDTGAALRALTAAANGDDGCGPYRTVDTGSIGTDAIKVALLYKRSSVAPAGRFAILDAAADPRFIDTSNRPMLAQTFRQVSTGETFTVAVNHLKSKGSPCDDLGDPDRLDGQGNCSATRRAAAQAIVDWLATDPTGSGDPDFLVIGDLNSYAKEDPIQAILAGADDVAGTADDYIDLVDRLGGAPAYSYVFDGQIGYLDHALASLALAGQVTGAAAWHINADEPAAFDYNDAVADPGEASFEARPAALPLFAPDAFRSSDHDPLLIGLDLAPASGRATVISPSSPATTLAISRRPCSRSGAACAARRARCR